MTAESSLYDTVDDDTTASYIDTEGDFVDSRRLTPSQKRALDIAQDYHDAVDDGRDAELEFAELQSVSKKPRNDW